MSVPATCLLAALSASGALTSARAQQYPQPDPLTRPKALELIRRLPGFQKPIVMSLLSRGEYTALRSPTACAQYAEDREESAWDPQKGFNFITKPSLPHHLQQLGLLRLEEGSAIAVILGSRFRVATCTAVLTQAGQRASVEWKASPPAMTNGWAVVPVEWHIEIATPQALAVTGITQTPAFGTQEAVVSWRWAPTKYGSEALFDASVHTGTVHFKKYDDGWRIEGTVNVP